MENKNMNFKLNQKSEQDKKIEENLNKIKNKLMVLSGKGGVGKSTISVNIAAYLAKEGYKVGLMDVDLHGPNTLKMLGLEDKRLYSDGKNLIPLEYSENLKVISIASLLETPETPVIWRGPLKIGVIKQFLADVVWGELDWLVIDTPPGSGDEPLTVAQLIKDALVVIVTTPQEVSLLDIRKSISFSKQLGLKIAGLIENMSGLICPYCGKKIEIFKSGTSENVAKKMEIPYLGAIPMAKEIVDMSDEGKPYFVEVTDSEPVKEFKKIMEKIINK